MREHIPQIIAIFYGIIAMLVWLALSPRYWSTWGRAIMSLFWPALLVAKIAEPR